MKPWLAREALLVGERTVSRYEAATVVVVGIGGVGAYAAEMLARSGIGNIVIVDNDIVSPTNKNRQLLALESTMGRLKTDVLAERLRDINPEARITAIPQYLEPDSIPAVFGEITAECGAKPDFVVDAIDTLSPKLYLIKYCMDNAIPLVSSMGSGAKFDMTRIRIADISKSFNCPLAYIVRKRLRHMGISKGFKAVFSEELPLEDAIVPDEGRNKKSQVGTIPYLPAAFGCACAQAVLEGLKD